MAWHISIALCREQAVASHREIGLLHGYTDPSTVMYAYRRIYREIESNPALANHVECLRRQIAEQKAK